ncbi:MULTISPECIES: two-component regulator propeller domain-containing protein [unclassified Pseudoalteromonas]|uniref:two-component regulator propeller domain-containing protein n=1 Tax=unclassified Pseudoalteromonas TaxID=194690 RepID=UPI0025B2F132|nr:MULTISPECIES: two-component regulator propeller domain-containing protein [unclassified Pseudoalteromonas]MDN3378545.1 two-component regulator propeller domain-containing protein [Pseudoalteromonas sp. APC 3893]MDN3387042.1 two-component regulator propeller domain-containing protein [Pseudoalteromonas sp. APC 4017]
MKVKLWVLASFLCFFQVESAFAAFKHYSIEEGLSQSVVFNIEQDQLGFMWFATQDGLNRYDGNRFDVFKASAKNTNSLTNNYIYPLALDNQNKLFIGTRHGGVNQLNLYNYEFAAPFLKNKRITSVLPIKSWLFVGTFDGVVYRISRDSTKIEIIAEHLKKPVYALTMINSVLWIGTHGSGLFHYNLQTNQLVNNYLHNVFNSHKVHPSIFSIKEDVDSNVWLATQGGGVYRINLTGNEYINWRHDPNDPYSISSNQVRDIEFDDTGRVWFATRGGGVSIYDKSQKRFTHLKHDPFDRYSLAHNRVYSVFKDQTGIMWFGTANGINKLDPASLNFTKLKKPDPLSSNDSWALHEDPQQRLWYGSWGGGIDILDEKFNRLQHLDTQSSPLALSSNAVKVITQDKLGNTWIGTWADGINVITKQGELIRYNADDGNHGLSENSIYSLLVDNRNQVWVGTNGGGLFRFDRELNYFISYAKPQQGSALYIDAPRVTSLYQGSDDNLWIATDGSGAYKFNMRSENVTHFSKSSQGEGLSHNTVRAFLLLENSDMWLATSNGVNIIKAKSSRIIHLGIEEGLPNQVVYGLISQGQYVWLSTNNGLVKVNTKTLNMEHFQAKDGLQGNEFNAGAYYKTSQGKIIFGGTQGLTVFTPGTQTTKQLSAKLALTQLSFDDQPLRNSIGSELGMHYEVDKSRHLTIPFSVNRVSLGVNYLHYQEPKENRFRYRLTGFEQQWRSAAGSNIAIEYTNLPAGKYKLVVEATSNAGAKAITPLVINFHVITPWWQTPISYGLYFILLIGFIWLCSTLWTRRLRSQKHELERFVTLRTQEIATQKSLIEKQAVALSNTLENKVRFFTHASHELRTPLSLLVAPTQALLANERELQKREDLNLILRNAKRLEGLVDKLLTLTRFDESGDDEVKQLSLSVIAREVAEQFKVLGKQNLQFDYHIEEALYIDASREGLITIFNNLLSNAFKYTKTGKIEFKVFANHEQAVIEFIDTGRGIAEVELDKVYDLFYRATGNVNIEGSGVGLSIVKRLVDKYQGQIDLKSKLREGTQFTIKFKLITVQKRVKVESNKQVVLTHTVKNKHAATVIIVEDNDELRHYLKTELLQKYNVLTAENGDAAMKLMLKHVPDLLITDLMMPKMDGFELLKALHESRVTCHIPAIILTAKGDHESKLKGLNHYALDVITKPFDRAELLVKVDNWIAWLKTYHQGINNYNKLPTIVANRPNHDPKDAQLLSDLNEFLANHYQDTQLTVPRCAKELALSERQFQRKLKVLINISPTEYIRDYRLSKAAELLKQGRQINLVIDDVGFTSRSHFSKSFKAKFGMTAKEFQVSN